MSIVMAGLPFFVWCHLFIQVYYRAFPSYCTNFQCSSTHVCSLCRRGYIESVSKNETPMAYRCVDSGVSFLLLTARCRNSRWRLEVPVEMMPLRQCDCTENTRTHHGRNTVSCGTDTEPGMAVDYVLAIAEIALPLLRFNSP